MAIFGAVMALRYPTQTLPGAANALNGSILHFVRANGSQQGPNSGTLPACGPNGLYSDESPETGRTQFRDDNPGTCAVRSPHAQDGIAAVERLPVPIDAHTGAVDSFEDWDEPVILRIPTTVVQRLGGRKQGEAPSGLHYPYVCDTSRIYCDQAEPRVNTANFLESTTCWSRPELVDLPIHQLAQRLTRCPLLHENLSGELCQSVPEPLSTRKSQWKYS